jgi:hypothetical protein
MHPPRQCHFAKQSEHSFNDKMLIVLNFVILSLSRISHFESILPILKLELWLVLLLKVNVQAEISQAGETEKFGTDTQHGYNEIECISVPVKAISISNFLYFFQSSI